MKWVSKVYLQGETIWTHQPKVDSSWQWKKLHKVKEQLAEGFDGDAWRIAVNGRYSISSGYSFLQGDMLKEPFSAWLWKSKAIPKHIFIALLAGKGRLLTLDRIQTWGVVVEEPACVLCGEVVETFQHLFFGCAYSRELIFLLADWLTVMNVPTSFGRWKHWLMHLTRRRKWRQRVWMASFIAVVYHIWAERNARWHGQAPIQCLQRLRMLQGEVMLRVEAFGSSATQLTEAAYMQKLRGFIH